MAGTFLWSIRTDKFTTFPPSFPRGRRGEADDLDPDRHQVRVDALPEGAAVVPDVGRPACVSFRSRAAVAKGFRGPVAPAPRLRQNPAACVCDARTRRPTGPTRRRCSCGSPAAGRPARTDTTGRRSDRRPVWPRDTWRRHGTNRAIRSATRCRPATAASRSGATCSPRAPAASAGPSRRPPRSRARRCR